MVLSVLQSERMRMGDMMRRSFVEAQKAKQRPAVGRRLEAMRDECEMPALHCPACAADIGVFHDLSAALLELRDRLGAAVVGAALAAHLLQPGRVVFVASARPRRHHNKVRVYSGQLWTVLQTRFGHPRIGDRPMSHTLHYPNPNNGRGF